MRSVVETLITVDQFLNMVYHRQSKAHDTANNADGFRHGKDLRKGFLISRVDMMVTVGRRSCIEEEEEAYRSRYLNEDDGFDKSAYGQIDGAKASGGRLSSFLCNIFTFTVT